MYAPQSHDIYQNRRSVAGRYKDIKTGCKFVYGPLLCLICEVPFLVKIAVFRLFFWEFSPPIFIIFGHLDHPFQLLSAHSFGVGGPVITGNHLDFF